MKPFTTTTSSFSSTSLKLNKYLIAAGFIGPIIFFLTIYLIFPFFYSGFDPVNQTISELGAIDSPIKTLTNVLGFGLTGILIMIFSFGIFRSKEINKFGKLSSIFFFFTGLFMYLVGVFPGDSGTGETLRSLIHEIVANYQFPILAIGLIIFALSVSSNPKLKYLTSIILVFGVITLILAYYLLLFIPPLPYIGILQRFAIGIPYILIALIAYSIYRVQ